MKYTGNFRSLKDKDYTIEITTSQGSGTTQLRFGPEAFVTNMDSGSSTIYVPVKYQSATIQVVAKNYHFDMYSKTPTENSVVLKDTSTGEIYWAGYISCNVYDANYNFETESWSVECVDRLSVLKNFDYTPCVSGDRGFATFASIIRHCMSTAGFSSSDYWYISTSTHHPDYSSYFEDNLVISEQNFFDEDDVPMKMSEVLEEICKYMGVTAVADGTSVYFIDYDAIRNGNFTFRRHTVGSSNSTSVTLSTATTHTIGPDSYSSTGSTLSLDNVYSKVTVRDSLYAVKSIIPSLFDDDDLQNAHYVSENDQRWNYEFSTSCVYSPRNWLGYATNTTDDDVYFYIKSRFYENKKYIHHYFTNDGSQNDSLGPILNGLQAENITGLSFAKYNIGSGNTSSEAYAGLDFDNFDNYLMIPANHTKATGLKRLEAKTDFIKPFFMSGKTKLIVKGEMILVDRGTFPNAPDAGNNTNIGYWPHTGNFVGDWNGWYQTKNTIKKKQSMMNLKIGMAIGNTSKTFKVPFYPIGKGDEYLKEDGGTNIHHEIFFKSFGVQDNVVYTDCIKEKGYKLEMNLGDSTLVPAKPLISIYGMDDMVSEMYKMDENYSPLACLFIKDFDVVAVDPYEGGDENVNATDTEYSYTINDNYTQELSPIEFKVCTSDSKSLNYSSVAWVISNNYTFVNTLVNDALSSKLIADGESSAQRAENLMCYKIVKQYSEPAKKLTCNLFDDLIKPWSYITEPAQAADGTPLLNCSFIVNTISHNYSYDTVTCELVEKK